MPVLVSPLATAALLVALLARCCRLRFGAGGEEALHLQQEDIPGRAWEI